MIDGSWELVSAFPSSCSGTSSGMTERHDPLSPLPQESKTPARSVATCLVSHPLWLPSLLYQCFLGSPLK